VYAPAPCPHTPTLTWDIFCHVIDNWGDLGVSWRLAADLAGRGQRVRLWVDDPSPLAWMAPGALEGRWPGVELRPWPRGTAATPVSTLPPGDVLIAAFGCEIDPAWVRTLQPDDAPGQAARVWINLEYLSAERWVERMHRLPSPQPAGPLAGRVRWFFHPGFTPATGGLLREPGLPERQQAFDREGWRRRHGACAALGSTPGGPWLTLFSYEPPALGELLTQPGLARAHWLVAAGRARAAMDQAWHDTLPCTRFDLAPMPQPQFDEVLWASDLNLVRGEDSLVRALWAGEALVWHIYPQHDDAHHDKLEAFLDWLDAPASLRHFHRVWNGVVPGPLPGLDLPAWRACVQAARERLLGQADLVSQMLQFVQEKGRI
jgi:uncharacterized repeat protein (TIGR03837 family)